MLTVDCVMCTISAAPKKLPVSTSKGVVRANSMSILTYL
ncbi:hypothetical protein RUE5091_00255 [Ruegeria denitrificans]|uniref:Uncharacterized protein n=1 Tax=Ruegeria denitrificans TaxID=1715692 RepID=A0A0P1I1I3_9RHOB|nr:hypothetical protein RUE5091_00255 [Ruegeria denitrificans]